MFIVKYKCRIGGADENDCWQVEAVDGPLVRVGDLRVKTILVVIIDMISGLVTHGEFYLSDNYLNRQDALMKAIGKFGLPRWYCDERRSSGQNRQISVICAELGIIEAPSRPERFIGNGMVEDSPLTCEQRWMEGVYWDQADSLESLNRSYQEFLDRECNNYPRPSIGMTPKERYLMDHDRIRFVDKEALEEAFLQRAMRKVSREARINLFRNEYATERELIGRMVQVRYRAGDLSRIYIYDSRTGKRICTAYPVQKNTVSGGATDPR